MLKICQKRSADNIKSTFCIHHTLFVSAHNPQGYYTELFGHIFVYKFCLDMMHICNAFMFLIGCYNTYIISTVL